MNTLSFILCSMATLSCGLSTVSLLRNWRTQRILDRDVKRVRIIRQVLSNRETQHMLWRV